MMTKPMRRRFTREHKEQDVARLFEDGVTYASLASELGVTAGQLKSWHLELLAAGSAAALAQSKAEPAELAHLRRDNKRLKEENEVMRKGEPLERHWSERQWRTLFSLGGRRRHDCASCIHRHPHGQPFDPPTLPRPLRQPELVPCLATHSTGTGGACCPTRDAD